MESARIDPKHFEELQSQLQSRGPDAAIEQLCQILREKKDYHNLFYALLMKKRHELGVSPIPTAPASQLPAEVHAPYEEGIRNAAHEVGELFLRDHNIPGAWAYYRMLGESKPVETALESFTPGENDDIEPLIGIAYHEGIHPRKGFDLILERYGLCSAITTLGGHQFPHGPEVRDYCIKRVIRALYSELRDRLAAEINRVEKKMPPVEATVHDLMQGRFWLFSEDIFHVDISHLGAVVQLSIHLSPCEELNLARELCEYGDRLSPALKYNTEPPFDKMYKDYGIYLAILAGDNVEEGLSHFRKKIEALDLEEYGTYPVEVFVNMLLRVGRDEEALQWASKYLVAVDERQLTCPGIIELCEKSKNYRLLSELARKHDNLVHFVAGLLAEKPR